jgi:hypothetical protein
MRILIIAFVAFIFLLRFASAEVLNPGETTLEILGINLTALCDPNDDFTGTCQPLALNGDLSYLNIKWIAFYADGIERDIGVECYLNCPNPGKDIDTNCTAYRNSTNYCTYTAKTGYGFCTIVNPNYLFKNQINNVTCKFYDPARTGIKYLPYPNRTFFSTNFDIFTTKNESVTVGKRITLGLSIRNNGLLITNFTSNVSVGINPQLVMIENPANRTGQLRYNQIGKLNPTIILLSAEKANLIVLTKSDIDPTVCYNDGDCAVNYLCLENKCWSKNIISINAENSSLPDFGLIGFIQIMVLAAGIVSVSITIKSKKSSRKRF